MIRSRWHLPLLLGLLAVAAPLAANDTQQVLFNFVKPMAVVGITLEDADLPSATAEATPEGDILRRVTFSPAQRPTLRMSPALGRWDWSAADYVSLRIQNAMSWDMTLEVAIEGEQGAPGLQASIELPAGPPQTLLVPLRAVSPEALGMRAGPRCAAPMRPRPHSSATGNGRHRRATVSAACWVGRCSKPAVSSARKNVAGAGGWLLRKDIRSGRWALMR